MINLNATFGVQIVNLLVLIGVLNRLYYKPVRRMMAQRADTLAKGLADAEAMEIHAESQAKEYQDNWRRERASLMERLAEMHRDTEAQAQKIIGRSQTEAKAQFQEVRLQVGRELEAARRDVKEQAKTIAHSMASKLLGRQVS